MKNISWFLDGSMRVKKNRLEPGEFEGFFVIYPCTDDLHNSCMLAGEEAQLLINCIFSKSDLSQLSWQKIIFLLL